MSQMHTELAAADPDTSKAQVTFVGYAADRPLMASDTAKDAVLLWTSASGGAGIVFFTGSYWSVLHWRAASPKERDAIKARARSAKPDRLPYLGSDGHVAAFNAWHDKIKPTQASPQQIEFLATLGPSPPDPLPALVADMAIPLLRSARQLQRGKAQMPDCFAPVVEQVTAAVDRLHAVTVPVSLGDYWSRLLEVDREVFRRAESE